MFHVHFWVSLAVELPSVVTSHIYMVLIVRKDRTESSAKHYREFARSKCFSGQRKRSIFASQQTWRSSHSRIKSADDKRRRGPAS